MATYSHTRLSTFENCPLQYKFAYIDRIKREEDSIEAFMGSRFHETMEKAYAEQKFRTPTLEELKDSFNEQWERNWGEHVFVVRADRTPEDYRTLGLKAVEQYYARHAPFDEGRLIAIEKRVVIDLDGSGKYKVQGYIDRLVEQEDGHYEVHDYKTSGRLPEQHKLDEDRQLALYEIGVRELWPQDVREVDLVWHYVIFDKEMRSRRTPEQLEELKTSTIALIDEIEACEEFPPRESGLCRYCSYQDICPLFAHGERVAGFPPNKYLKDDGVQLVNTLAELDAKKRALQVDLYAVEEEIALATEAAIDYAQREGLTRLVGSERELTFKDEIAVTYPKSTSPDREAFEEGLRKAGLWERVSGFVAQTFKALARKEWSREGIPGPVAPYVGLEHVTKAKLSRPKNEESVM